MRSATGTDRSFFIRHSAMPNAVQKFRSRRLVLLAAVLRPVDRPSGKADHRHRLSVFRLSQDHHAPPRHSGCGNLKESWPQVVLFRAPPVKTHPPVAERAHKLGPALVTSPSDFLSLVRQMRQPYSSAPRAGASVIASSVRKRNRLKLRNPSSCDYPDAN